MAEYIDRQKIGLTDFEIIMCGDNYKEAFKLLLEKIEKLPVADVQPVKHGKWKLLGEPPWYVRECSECGGKWYHWHEYELPRYCNNCGATMDGGKDDGMDS